MSIDRDCSIAEGVTIYQPNLVNLYGCRIGPETTIAPFVEIQRGAVIGESCKICSHAFVCAHVLIGNRVFVGHGVMFCNDRYPVIGGPLHLAQTRVCDDVSIGSGAVLLPGICIGPGAIIGAGAVVTRSVPPLAVVAGNPAHILRQLATFAERQAYLSRAGGALS